MLETGLHMTSTLAASWLPWVCLAMIGLIWLSCIMQPQYIRGLLSNGFSSSPGAAEQTPSIGSQIMQWLFNSILPAIAIYTITAHTAIYGSALFGWLVALSILSDLVRALSGLIVQYTFRFGKRASMAYLRYFSLRSLFTYVLFIIVLLITYSSVGTCWWAFSGQGCSAHPSST